MPALNEKKKLRVGILGCSDIALRKFIPALLQSDLARLAALARREPDSSVSMISGIPVPLMTYQELVCAPDIDLIYISLPNHLHEKWSIAALDQGKHVLCEKPLGLCTNSVNRMLEAAKQHGRFLFENLMYLQHPQHKAVKTFIASGDIGRILSLKSEFAFPGPVDGDFRLNPVMGGGAFHDMNRYPLSAARFFLEGKTHHFLRGYEEMRDGLTLSLNAESVTDAGEKFSFLTAFNQPYRSFYEIGCECGSVRVERAYTTPSEMENRIVVTVNGSDKSFSIPPSDHFLATIEHVCGLIRGGHWETEHEQTRKLAELAEMFRDNCIRRELRDDW